MRERQALPDSYEDAVRFVNDIAESEVDGHFERLLGKLGYTGDMTPRRRRKRFAGAFRRSLSGQMREHFTSGERRLGSGVSWASVGTRVPTGSIAAEDIAGGTWTQLLAWAAFEAEDASKALESHGATTHTPLKELARLDLAATLRLMEAHLALGILPFDEGLATVAPREWMGRLQQAASARSAVASRGFVFGAYRPDPPVAMRKSDALSVLLASSRTAGISNPSLVIAVRTKQWVAEHLVDPR